MNDAAPLGGSKADFIADCLNKTLYTLVTNCTKSDGVRPYFDVAVVAYSSTSALPGLGAPLDQLKTYSITDIADKPLAVENRVKLESDGAGGVIERKIKFPVWFKAMAGGGTPMCSALREAARLAADWCDQHPDSYPPTILNVTDGESTDGDPGDLAQAIARLGTKDGPALLFNLHVSSHAGEPSCFPAAAPVGGDPYAALLYRMSSMLPPHLAGFAREFGYKPQEGARGYMFNADPKDIVNFFAIGTRPRLSADR